MTKCKFYNECKNQQLSWDLYAGIARDAKKTSGYFGNYMRVLQLMQNEECERLFVPYMRVLQGMQNASGYYGHHMRVL